MRPVVDSIAGAHAWLCTTCSYLACDYFEGCAKLLEKCQVEIVKILYQRSGSRFRNLIQNIAVQFL